MPTRKVMLFTGAPPATSITSESCTLTGFGREFRAFITEEKEDTPGRTLYLEPQTPLLHAAWRSLPLNRHPLYTGLSQTHNLSDGSMRARNDDFFTTADVPRSDCNDPTLTPDETTLSQDLLTQFCEQSLAAHDADPSSPQPVSFETSILTEETSFGSTPPLSAEKERSIPKLPSHLSDLEDIPAAAHIISLNPQTVTLNVIVAVLSIAQPRIVTTRWGKQLSLVEILVADETKSGFAITFWLSSEEANSASISKLRRQDVVSAQNVALHVFKDKVYGQSLRKGLTKVSLLWRRDGGGYYSTRTLNAAAPLDHRHHHQQQQQQHQHQHQHHPQLEKTRVVKDWVIKFVGRDPKMLDTCSLRKSWDQPPDDTQ